MNTAKIKYLLFLLPLIAVTFQGFSQRKGFDNLTHFDDRKLHFGFYLGMNTMDYRLTNYKNIYDNPVLKDPVLNAQAQAVYGTKNSFAAEIYQIMPGFTVGGVVNARLGRDFDLRFTPGMSLGNRRFKYLGIEIPKTIDNLPTPVNYLYTPSAYVDLPVGIRYKGFRHRNLRPYIYAGAAYRQDLENKSKSENVVHLKKSGQYAELALGLDSYLEYFRFTAEFRFSYGLNNLIRHDIGVEHIPYFGYMFKELNSNLFTLIFYFE